MSFLFFSLGFTANSNELVLENKITNPYVEKGQELRVWYGEDLKEKYDGDNSGRSCVEVYAKIRPGKRYGGDNLAVEVELDFILR